MSDKTEAASYPTEEHRRRSEGAAHIRPWERWGPFVAERSWGTVREDYSENGDAWAHFPHEQARSRVYRWGEDGLAGLCDRYQLLVFALALWNERDPFLKERAFGLVPSEGNHGEDVKEYYFYLDNTPTHSYMKYLYKYPQSEFPYRELILENQRRQGRGFEYELLDTGVFDEDRYFDVFVEYAKASTEDVCIRIEAFNRGPDVAPLHIVPHLWFRNTWCWSGHEVGRPRITPGPRGEFLSLIADDSAAEPLSGLAVDYTLGFRYLYAQKGARLLFTDNETNPKRAPLMGAPSQRTYYKDAFHDFIVHGVESAISPRQTGTKACLSYKFQIPPGESVVLRLRLTNRELSDPLHEVESIVKERKQEADKFYDTVHPARASEDERQVQRQAFAGLLWNKQLYIFDVQRWMEGDPAAPPPPASHREIRNQHWGHLNSMRLLLMPDKWEYPWFAAWDLAFHSITMTLIDAELAKNQLWLMLFEQFQHPNGQLPAYEWEFSDLNPPVHAWAVWRVYNMDRIRSGRADRDWLERCFHKLLINFAWWVNKVDNEGNNIFEGGFLGLDNITVIDRSQKLPGGVVLEQSDATGWMGLFCLNLMRIALELAKENKVYENLATKFFQHYVYVGAAMKRRGGRDYSLWDERDGFFYDVLRFPDGSFHKFRVRSLVGIIPLYAIERLEVDWIKPFSVFKAHLEWFVENRQDLVQRCCHLIRHENIDVWVLAVVDQHQTETLLETVLDPSEFLSSYGIRSLSKFHEEHPYIFDTSEVRYEPAETDSKLKGGNSNWRGPIWFPTCFLLIESLRKLGKAYGPNFMVRSPATGGQVSLTDMSRDIANRLISIFVRNGDGCRPLYGGIEKFQTDPHWRDYLMFHEYFHGDNGAGIGASHQTGWTSLVASLIDEWRN